MFSRPKVGGSNRRQSRNEGIQPVQPVLWWFVLALLSAAALGYLLTRQTTVGDTKPHPYTSTYTLNYSANVPPSAAYDSTTLKFGDTVFRTLANAVQMTIDYKLTNGDTATAQGMLTTKVTMEGPSGWVRTVYEGSPVPVSGSTAKTAIPLDLNAMADLAKRAEEQVNPAVKAKGFELNAKVKVSAAVTAVMKTPGVEDRQMPSSADLEFALTDISLKPVLKTSSSAAASLKPGAVPEGEGVANNGATQTTTRMLTIQSTKPATFKVGPVEAEVEMGRYIAGAVLAFSVVISLYNFLAMALASRKGEAARLAAEYGSALVPLLTLPEEIERRAVVVGTFEALAAAAGNAETEILHHHDGGSDRYFVLDGPNVYCYQARARA